MLTLVIWDIFILIVVGLNINHLIYSIRLSSKKLKTINSENTGNDLKVNLLILVLSIALGANLIFLGVWSIFCISNLVLYIRVKDYNKYKKIWKNK